MKGQTAELSRRLSANTCCRKLFTTAFPDGRGRMDFGAVARALAAYQPSTVRGTAPRLVARR